MAEFLLRSRKRPVHVMPVLMCVLCGVSLAQAGELSWPAPWGNTEVSGFAKVMYVADDKKGGRVDQSTLGIGGRLAVDAGQQGDGLRMRAALYTTQDLGWSAADPRRIDAYMFDVDKRPYSILGEAQLRHAAGPWRTTIGRQEFVSPIIHSYEYRIVPNLYEGVSLEHRQLAQGQLTFAYLQRMSGLDSLTSYAEFRSMSQQAYLSFKADNRLRLDPQHGQILDVSQVVGHRGVWVAGYVHEGTTRWQLWNFYGQDMTNTVYADMRYRYPVNTAWSAQLEAQAYRVQDVGAFGQWLAEQGLQGRYALLGVRTTLAHAPSGLGLALAANRYTGNAHTVTSAGNWGGYPEFILMPYMYAEQTASAIADSRLWRFVLTADLARHGLPGHSLLFGHARINTSEHIIANSDIRVNSVLYRARLDARWSARIQVDHRQSANSRYDNAFVTVGVRYDF